jgi:N12 class adenine-specific DNA methylase
VLRRNEGRGVFFMTGAPISNTLTEAFTIQR